MNPKPVRTAGNSAFANPPDNFRCGKSGMSANSISDGLLRFLHLYFSRRTVFSFVRVALALLRTMAQPLRSRTRTQPPHRLQMALRTHFTQTKIGCPGVAEFTVQRTEALFDHITGLRQISVAFFRFFSASCRLISSSNSDRVSSCASQLR